MDIGMMWFDNDQNTSVMEKVERAAAFYRDKYGSIPNLCFAHPVTMGKAPIKTDSGIDVLTSGAILPDCFWIGLDESPENV